MKLQSLLLSELQIAPKNCILMVFAIFLQSTILACDKSYWVSSLRHLDYPAHTACLSVLTLTPPGIKSWFIIDLIFSVSDVMNILSKIFR